MIHARPVGITPLVFMHKIGLAEKSCASNHAWSGLTAMSPIYRNHVDGRGHTRATVPRQAQAASRATPEGDGRRGHRPEPGGARALAGSYSYSGQLPSPERTLTTQHDTFIFRSCGLGLIFCVPSCGAYARRVHGIRLSRPTWAERVLGTCVRPGAAEPDGEPAEG